MDNLLKITTIDELRYALRIQATMQRKATVDLDELYKQVVAPCAAGEGETIAGHLMDREVALLAHYAGQPTLHEYAKSTFLRGAMQPGATFAVTALLGETVLAGIRALTTAFVRVHPTLLMITLSELTNPASEEADLAKTYMRTMHIQLDPAMVEKLSERERRTKIHSMLLPVSEAITMVAERYGLITVTGDGKYTVTEIGNRIMVHMFDAQRFIETVRSAHAALQLAAQHAQGTKVPSDSTSTPPAP